MEQALVFATTAGLGYYWLRGGYQNALNRGPDLQGVNTIGGQPSVNEPVHVPNPQATNFTNKRDLTPAVRARQQELIDASKFESRHHVLDPFKYQGERTVGQILDTTVDRDRWTKTTSDVDQ
jgi:hypothetical protein